MHRSHVCKGHLPGARVRPSVTASLGQRGGNLGHEPAYFFANSSGATRTATLRNVTAVATVGPSIAVGAAAQRRRIGGGRRCQERDRERGQRCVRERANGHRSITFDFSNYDNASAGAGGTVTDENTDPDNEVVPPCSLTPRPGTSSARNVERHDRRGHRCRHAAWIGRLRRRSANCRIRNRYRADGSCQARRTPGAGRRRCRRHRPARTTITDGPERQVQAEDGDAVFSGTDAAPSRASVQVRRGPFETCTSTRDLLASSRRASTPSRCAPLIRRAMSTRRRPAAAGPSRRRKRRVRGVYDGTHGRDWVCRRSSAWSGRTGGRRVSMTRYAEPNGDGTPGLGGCLVSDWCSIETAVEDPSDGRWRRGDRPAGDVRDSSRTRSRWTTR